ncbi:MAG: hypothetical protein ACTSRA_07985 [Promethearchaeota archaeon]
MSLKIRCLMFSAILIFIGCGCIIYARAPVSWQAWIPGDDLLEDWSIPEGGNFTSTIKHLLVSPDNGESNDTTLYSQLFLGPDNNILLVNYLDFEEASGTSFTANIFDLSIPSDQIDDVNNEINKYTNRTFTGGTAWDLVSFIFKNVWSHFYGTVDMDAEDTSISSNPAIIMDFKGNFDIGLVAFVNLGNKACIAYNMANSSPWVSVTYYQENIQSLNVDFLAPVRQVMYAAQINQYSIFNSSIKGFIDDLPPAQVVDTVTNDLLAINPSLDSNLSYLEKDQFLEIMSMLVGRISVPSYPTKLSTTQIISIILIIVAIGLIIYYAISTYKKEKKKIPEAIKEFEDT